MDDKKYSSTSDNTNATLRLLAFPVEPEYMAALLADVTISLGIDPIEFKKRQHSCIQLGLASPEPVAATNRTLQVDSRPLAGCSFL
jgi:hypothetical protein